MVMQWDQVLGYINILKMHGASGIAMSLVCSEEQEYLTYIEKLLGMQIQSGVVEGFEPTKGP